MATSKWSVYLLAVVCQGGRRVIWSFPRPNGGVIFWDAPFQGRSIYRVRAQGRDSTQKDGNRSRVHLSRFCEA